MYQSNMNDVLEANTLTCEKKESIIKTARQLFYTYGYDEIETAIFEPYDLYSSVDGMILQDDMVKVIGPSGKVLVLRPDVTIPVARLVTKHVGHNEKIKRYFYIMDVFRQAANRVLAHKQIGVELFGDDSTESDTEVLALAYELLANLPVTHFTIEVGHAGFVQQILEETNLPYSERQLLKQYIQSKNKTDLQTFLIEHQVSQPLQRVILQIVDLYGPPGHVIERARTLSLNKEMNQAIDHLERMHQLLDLYGMTENIVFNLGLINHMDYYSDVIFQGFIARVGEPVLMGGRYDTLTEKIGIMMPAVGFGCDIQLLIDGLKKEQHTINRQEDIVIYYTPTRIREAYQLMRQLRQRSKRVLINHKEINVTHSARAIYLQEQHITVFNGREKRVYPNIDSFLTQYQL